MQNMRRKRVSSLVKMLFALLNWDDCSIVEKRIVVGTKTFVIAEAYDETVKTCSVCGWNG